MNYPLYDPISLNRSQLLALVLHIDKRFGDANTPDTLLGEEAMHELIDKRHPLFVQFLQEVTE